MFWNYFQKLKFLLIEYPGIFQGLVRGASLTLDQAREDIFYLREQFLSSETDQISKLAGSRGLHQYPGETDSAFRYRLIHAHEWWKKTQSGRGLAEILMQYTGLKSLQLKKLDDPERWAEFIIDAEIPEGGIDSSQYSTLLSAIDELKQASSKLAGVNVQSTVEPCEITVAAALATGVSSIYNSCLSTKMFYIPLPVLLGNQYTQSYVTIRLSDSFSDWSDVLDCGSFQLQATEVCDCGLYSALSADVVENGLFYERM